MIWPSFVVALSALACATAQSLRVTTQQGVVLGHLKDGSIEFQGIPYAKPPVGQLRWAAPELTPARSSPYSADFVAPGCPQHCNLPPGNCPDVTSEDCLYMNIWTPTTPSIQYRDGYPVYFWIHGGAFEQGLGDCALYNATKLAAKGMVVVAINYRLGALGFMKSASMTGNYGLMDQQLALKWVNDNIASFGGNPKDITIGGQSAGAMSVSCHMTSPASTGLFQQAILESNPWALPYHTSETAQQNADAMADYMKCARDDIQCFRARSVEEVLEAQDKAPTLNLQNLFLNFLPFTPVVGNDILPDQPLYAIRDGNIPNPVPFMGGSVKNDALLFVYELFTKPLGAVAYREIINVVFGTEISSSILKLYPANLLGNTDDTRPVLDVLGTDLLFYCPLRNITRGLQAAKDVTAYIYRFDHIMSFDCWGPGYEYCVGVVCHGSELPFEYEVWTDGKDITYYPTQDELQLSKDMMTYWANYVRHHNPNLGENVPTLFPSYGASSDSLLVLEEPVVQATHQRVRYCDFWDSVGYFW